MNKSMQLAFLTFALSGCASMPDVEYRYYGAKATTSVAVTQGIDCTQDKKQVIVTHSPSVTTVYSSDSSKAYGFKARDLSGFMSDSQIKVEWYEDGRLKAVNQSVTGQGEAITKAAVSLAGTAVGGGGSQEAACAALSALGGGKALVLVYEGTIFYSPVAPVTELKPSANSRALYAQVKKAYSLPRLDFKLEGQAEGRGPFVEASSANDVVPLTLNRLEVQSARIVADGTPIWGGKITVPTEKTYQLPMPKAKLFGKRVLGLALSEAGGISSLSYDSTSGVASGLTAANGLLGVVSPTDAAEVTSAETEMKLIKAEADVIAQTQRLATCRAKPADCK